MKLLRYGAPGREKTGLLDENGELHDLSGKVTDIGAATLLPVALEAVRAINSASFPRVEGESRIGPCAAGVGKIVCVRLNYRNHAAESNMPVPSEPVLFLKTASAIVGPDDIEIPPGTTKIGLP